MITSVKSFLLSFNYSCLCSGIQQQSKMTSLVGDAVTGIQCLSKDNMTIYQSIHLNVAYWLMCVCLSLVAFHFSKATSRHMLV